ncbi:MAG: hypothetical protein ABI672_12365 [Vicinamibacteria bacterium]
MRHLPTKALLGLVCSLGAIATVRAQDPKPKLFSFGAFATAGVVHSTERQATFTSNPFKPNGAGFPNAWSASTDTVLGAQLTARVTRKLSAVVQLVSEQNHDGGYRPRVEWANVAFLLTPDLTIRAGRIVLPAFLMSESGKVGYSYPWVRPPADVYLMVPISKSDGLDVTYRLNRREWTTTLQATVGRSDVRLIGDGGSAKARDFWGLAAISEHGALTTRLSYRRADIFIASLNSLFDGFRQFGAEGQAIADRYDVNHKTFSTVIAGASYDPGRFFVTSEWGRVAARSVQGRKNAWYVSGGYRIGPVTPYMIYAQARADNLSDPGLTLSSLPASVAGAAAGLNAALNSVLSIKPVQNTVSLGGRWDFSTKAALKVQMDHSDLGAGSSGLFSNLQPSYRTGGSVNLLTATLSVVF